MPTPSDTATRFSPAELSATAQSLTTCPPEASGQSQTAEQSLRTRGDSVEGSSSPQPAANIEKGSEDVDREASLESEIVVDEQCVNEEEVSRNVATDSNVSRRRSSSPLTARPPSAGGITTASTASSTLEFSSIRVIPSYPSSFLRYGSKFVGRQQSDKQKYHVEVDIKNVDLVESTICGYLRIDGLTPDHPLLTTFFEGEIVGPKYSFITRHETWGATEKTDMQHWDRFPAFRPLSKQVKKSDYYYNNVAQRENIFMRWKEKFLVPDYRVKEISGASFEGFYYICFNQVHGTITGIYFHAKSEKYQQLDLKHVQDRYCLGGMEFR